MSTHRSPARAATPATWRGWLDCTPPMDTSVSQRLASASATRYSSLRVLLPPYAMPEWQSSRLAQIAAPPRWAERRSSGVDRRRPEQQRVAGERREGHQLNI